MHMLDQIAVDSTIIIIIRVICIVPLNSYTDLLIGYELLLINYSCNMYSRYLL